MDDMQPAWVSQTVLICHKVLPTATESRGMTRRMIAHYRTGSKPISKVVGLACKGREAEHANRTDWPTVLAAFKAWQRAAGDWAAHLMGL